MEENQMAYTFKKWNGKYGNAAKFIVENDDDKKQSMYAPARPSDVTWTSSDLTKDPEVEHWEDFGEEKIESLDNVVF